MDGEQIFVDVGPAGAHALECGGLTALARNLIPTR